MGAEQTNTESINPRARILSVLVAHSGKSQAAVAAEAQVCPSHLSRVLRGQVHPTDETFERIIRAAGWPPQRAWLALASGPDHLPLITQSDFLTRLVEELPAQLVEHLGSDLIDADPRWATGIISFVVTKTQETVARKRKAEAEFRWMP